MLARWPGKIAPGRVTDHISANWDVLPTIADLTAVKPPEGIDGLSFAPLLLGEGEQKKHDYLYWEFPAYGGQQAVRRGDWKALRQNMLGKKNKDSKNKDPKNKDPLRIELYNLKEDLAEKRDLAAEHPDIVAQMRDIMRTAHQPSKLFPLGPVDGPHAE
jgi:arylsulfatase